MRSTRYLLTVSQKFPPTLPLNTKTRLLMFKTPCFLINGVLAGTKLPGGIKEQKWPVVYGGCIVGTVREIPLMTGSPGLQPREISEDWNNLAKPGKLSPLFDQRCLRKLSPFFDQACIDSVVHACIVHVISAFAEPVCGTLLPPHPPTHPPPPIVYRS